MAREDSEINLYSCYCKLAQALIDHNDFSAAIEQYENAEKYYSLTKEEDRYMIQIGDYYYSLEDYLNATKWYEKAHCHVENLSLCYMNLANHYYLDNDFSNAFTFYKKAAELGDNHSQNMLGKLYASGNGIDQDNDTAASWYRQAAKQGNVNAQFNLGNFYRFGIGTNQNLEKAIALYMDGAEAGDADSLNALGECHFSGEGVDKNDYKTFGYCFEAAQKGHAEAQYNVGFCFENGYAVQENIEKAIEWYKKSADQGFDLAIQQLKICERVVEQEKKGLKNIMINKSVKIVGYAEMRNNLKEPIEPDMFGQYPEYLVIKKLFAETNLSKSALKYAEQIETDYIWIWHKSAFIVEYELPRLFENVIERNFGEILRYMINYCFPYVQENNITDGEIYEIYKENSLKEIKFV